jgi:hypothetical protein
VSHTTVISTSSPAWTGAGSFISIRWSLPGLSSAEPPACWTGYPQRHTDSLPGGGRRSIEQVRLTRRPGFTSGRWANKMSAGVGARTLDPWPTSSGPRTFPRSP